MQRQWHKLFFIGIITAYILYGCGSIPTEQQQQQQQQDTEVILSPQSGAVRVGDTFTRSVDVKNMGKTFYAAFDISYDPNIIEYVSSTEGTVLNRNGRDATSFQVALQGGKQGRITIGITRLGNIGDVAGDGILLTLSFRAVAPGSTSVTFTNPKSLKNSGNQDVVITATAWENGTVTVQ